MPGACSAEPPCERRRGRVLPSRDEVGGGTAPDRGVSSRDSPAAVGRERSGPYGCARRKAAATRRVTADPSGAGAGERGRHMRAGRRLCRDEFPRLLRVPAVLDRTAGRAQQARRAPRRGRVRGRVVRHARLRHRRHVPAGRECRALRRALHPRHVRDGSPVAQRSRPENSTGAGGEAGAGIGARGAGLDQLIVTPIEFERAW